VSQDGGSAENTRVGQNLDRGPAVGFETCLGLAHGLGGMDVDSKSQALRLQRDGFEKSVVTCVRSVGRQPRGDTSFRCAPVLVGKGRGLFHTGVPLAAEDRPCQSGPCAGLFHGMGHPVHVKVVVGYRGHTRLDHLGQPQLHPPIDVVRGEIALQWPDVLVEPGLDVHVFGKTPKKGHGHVGMGVDQAGHGEHPPPFDRLAIFSHRQRTRGPHCRESIAADQYVVTTKGVALAGFAPEHIDVADQQLSHG